MLSGLCVRISCVHRFPAVRKGCCYWAFSHRVLRLAGSLSSGDWTMRRERRVYQAFFVAYIASKILGMSHDIAAPAGMIGASNFFELAAAVAITLFGTTSPAALATTVGVLTEVPVMLALVKAANNTKGWFKS